MAASALVRFVELDETGSYSMASLDFKNAFNLVDREVLIRETIARIPQLAAYAAAARCSGSPLFMRPRNSVGDSSAMRRKLRLKWDRLWKPTS